MKEDQIKIKNTSSLNNNSPNKIGYKKNSFKNEKVAIIGGGWSGSHIACEFAERFDVTLFEAKDRIFKGVSGNFGIRIHAGPHYPRSLATRTACQLNASKFLKHYPELVREHDYAVYAIGKKDADEKPSKVNHEDFRQVCKEYNFKGEVDLDTLNLNPKEIHTAFDIDEPSAILGEPLRQFFEKRLAERKVKIRYNFRVTDIKKQSGKIMITGVDKKSMKEKGAETYLFDHVINATSFQSLLPKEPLPFRMKIIYQPLLALKYEDQSPGEKPISFITMDGMFPCIMPRIETSDSKAEIRNYIVTHAKYTTVGSYENAQKAYEIYSLINDNFSNEKVRKQAEEHINRIWPLFSKRFKYKGWTGTVLGKIRTSREFRASVTFQSTENGVIYVFPGKITNVFNAENEALKLMKNIKGIQTSIEGYRYVAEGILDEAKKEITEEITDTSRNTCYLQTHHQTLARLRHPNSFVKTVGTSKNDSDYAINIVNSEVEERKDKKLGFYNNKRLTSDDINMKDYNRCSWSSLPWKIGKFVALTALGHLIIPDTANPDIHLNKFAILFSLLLSAVTEVPLVKTKIEQAQTGLQNYLSCLGENTIFKIPRIFQCSKDQSLLDIENEEYSHRSM